MRKKFHDACHSLQGDYVYEIVSYMSFVINFHDNFPFFFSLMKMFFFFLVDTHRTLTFNLILTICIYALLLYIYLLCVYQIEI